MLNRITMQLHRALLIPGLLAISLAGFTAGNALAQEEAKNPYTKADETWITLSGKVESVSPDTFVLDYGKGVITVEMDDGDRDADAYKLLKGDQVTVSGRIDDDFFETTTIEAYSVHVKNLDTTFFASALDEEDAAAYTVYYTTPLVEYHYNLVGTVTEVGPDEVIIDTGTRRVEVEVDEMAYDPLDDEGYQKIRVGDRISVAGNIDYDLFEGHVVEADSIVKLNYATRR